jgi:hypothetical protein
MDELASENAAKVTACIARGNKINSRKSLEDAEAPDTVKTKCESDPSVYPTVWFGGKNKRIRSVKSRKNKRKSSKKTQSKKKGGRSKSKKSN